ncbi:hypothetical protein ACSNOI_48070, partial [Actinomadura kijaniata]
EHDYRELKYDLGLEHFEGRTGRGQHHHVTLAPPLGPSSPCATAPKNRHAGLSLYQVLALYRPAAVLDRHLHGLRPPPLSSTRIRPRS